MVRNLIHICLAAVAIVVLFLPVREYFLNRAVTADLNQLTNLLGDFEVVDPKKVYIRALEINEHLRYAWRVYLPENTDIVHSWDISPMGGFSSGFSISSQGRPARQFVLHLQVEIQPDEIRMSMRGDRSGGAHMSSLKGRQHRDKIQELLDPKLAVVKQFGKAETVEVEIDQVLVLLELGTASAKALAEPIDPLARAIISPAAMHIRTSEEMQAMSSADRRKLLGVDRFKDFRRANEKGKR